MWWKVILLTARSNGPGSSSPLSRSTSRVRTLVSDRALIFASRTSSMPCELSTAVIVRTWGWSARVRRPVPHPKSSTSISGPGCTVPRICPRHVMRHPYPARVLVPCCRICIKIAFLMRGTGGMFSQEEKHLKNMWDVCPEIRFFYSGTMQVLRYPEFISLRVGRVKPHLVHQNFRITRVTPSLPRRWRQPKGSAPLNPD